MWIVEEGEKVGVRKHVAQRFENLLPAAHYEKPVMYERNPHRSRKQAHTFQRRFEDFLVIPIQDFDYTKLGEVRREVLHFEQTERSLPQPGHKLGKRDLRHVR